MHELFFTHILFYVVAGLAILAALMAVTQNNPVRCVLFLVLTFFAATILWLLAAAEFLALILILVYVGAVMTLFLFVVMLLNIDVESKKSKLISYLPFGLIIISLLVSLLLIAIPHNSFQAGNDYLGKKVLVQVNKWESISKENDVKIAGLSNTEQIGMVLYTQYVVAFELAAVILLVAIIASITLVHRKITRSKRQDITKQLLVRASERLSIIKMKVEK